MQIEAQLIFADSHRTSVDSIVSTNINEIEQINEKTINKVNVSYLNLIARRCFRCELRVAMVCLQAWYPPGPPFRA